MRFLGLCFGISGCNAGFSFSKYLYFVANNNGDHYFSKTYDEHLEAVKLYQLK